MESITILLLGVEDGSEFFKQYVNHSAYLKNRMTEISVVFHWSMAPVHESCLTFMMHPQ